MKPKWLASLWALRGNVLSGVERFPVSIAALACFVVMINLEIAGALTLANEGIVRAGAALGAATALATAAVLLGERRGFARGARHAASLLCAVLVAGAIWFWERFGVAPPALLVAAVLTVPLAPYLRGGRTGFWAFNWSLIHAGALAFIAVIIFCLGLSAILISLHFLFGLAIDGTIYGHVWSVGLGFVGPLFALSLVPGVFPVEDSAPGTDIIISGVRLLSDFVAVPLLATYAIILHAYALKILASGELPNNQIGWMVLSFGLCALALRMVVHPLAATARLPTRLFLRWWALPLVVPLALLVTATWLRIAAYGVTPERYGLALFALFLGIVLLAQSLRRLRGDIRLIPGIGAICLLVASFGPWGVVSASATSQTGRLITLLESAGALENDRVVATPEWDPNIAADIQSIVWLLSEIGQMNRLRPLFAGSAGDPFAASDAQPGRLRAELPTLVQTALGANRVDTVQSAGGFWLEPGEAGPVAIGGYDLMVPSLRWTGLPAVEQPVPGLPLSIEVHRQGLAFIHPAGRLEFPTAELQQAVTKGMDAARAQPPQTVPPIFLESTLEGRQVGLLIGGIGGFSAGETLVFHSGTVSVFLRRSDWDR